MLFKDQEQDQERPSKHSTKNDLLKRDVIKPLTRILSKADGVPPLWTWPKMVTLVSKPRRLTTSWGRRKTEDSQDRRIKIDGIKE